MSTLSSAIAGRRVWLCDLDGTLVDSGPAHEAAFREAIAELAPDVLGSFRYEVIAGASTRAAAAALVGDAHLAEKLARRKQRLYRDRVDAGMVALLPGARRFLDRLTAAGHIAYLVTGGGRGSVERVLAACSLDGYFRDVLTADDVAVSKPDPGFYARACRRWAVRPCDAVAVEDSSYGVASARGAGLVTLQVGAAAPLAEGAQGKAEATMKATGETALGAIPVRSLDDVATVLELEASSSE